MNKQQLNECFSYMHASEDTIAEVLKMANKQNDNKTRRHPVRTGVLIGLAAVLMIGAAYAAGTGFIQTVFGTKGQADIAPHEVVEEAKGSTYEAPGREWAQVDETLAEELVGDHIAAVGTSVSVGDWTLTVDDYTIDDRGIGAIVYTLSNPNGLDDAIRLDDTYGEYYVDGNNSDGLREIGLCGDSDTHMFDTRSIVDNTITTDTELHAVMYFAPFFCFEESESVHMSLKRVVGDPFSEDAEWEEQTITFTPDSFIPSAELVSAEGYTAHISPMGILFDASFEDIDPDAYTKTLTVQLTDGTEYVVRSSEPYMENSILGCASPEKGIEAHVFNRFVDVQSVVSVTRNGPNSTALVFTPMS